jgi:tetratricopeptide (TPR) repeat protein
MQVQKTVFISYRRTNIYIARAVQKDLQHRGYDVFLDYESIDSGAFSRIILGQIEARAHFLVILTPSALERCTNPDDWLRREIEHAMQHQRNVVPLIFEGFDFGKAKEYLVGDWLPLLRDYNGIEVPAAYFEEALVRLHTRFLSKPLEMILHPTPSADARVVREHVEAIEATLSPTPEQIKAEEYFERGFKLYSDGLLDEAERNLTRAILLNEQFAEAYYWRGHIYRRKKDTKRAVTDWREALQRTSDDRTVGGLLSNIYRLQKDYDLALHEANKIVEKYPRDPEVYMNRGSILDAQGKHEDAILDYNEALHLNLHHANAYVNRAVAFANLHDLKSALTDFETAIRLNPQHVIAYYNRGITRGKMGDLEGALADFEEAVRLNPQYADAIYSRGVVYFKKADLDKAIHDFEATLRIDPNHKSAMESLGFVRLQKGKN